MFLITVVSSGLILGAWEIKVREMGYSPTLNDTGDLWAKNRSLVESSTKEAVVIVGSSRILFDMDLDTYQDYFDSPRPIQLALPGGAPLPLIEDIAFDPAFRGTLIVGVVPPLYFAPPGSFPVERSKKAIKRFTDWSPSQRTGQIIGSFLEKRLAFIQQEDLTLNALIGRLGIPNRSAVKMPPEFPPYMYSIGEDRRAILFKGVAPGSELAKRIQKIWMPLFTPPPPPPGMDHKTFFAMFKKSMAMYLERTKKAVDVLKDKGGRVVFIRCPSTGKVRELENKYAPRQGFWDQILQVSGAPGIHFEDHPSLAHFECPEWSHLTVKDSVKFTKNLMPILKKVLAVNR